MVKQIVAWPTITWDEVVPANLWDLGIYGMCSYFPRISQFHLFFGIVMKIRSEQQATEAWNVPLLDLFVGQKKSTKSHVFITRMNPNFHVYVRCLDSVVIGYCSGIHAQCTSQVGIDECVSSHNLTRFSGTSCQTLAKHCNNPILKGASLKIWPRQEGPAACLTVSPHSPRKKQVVASFFHCWLWVGL